MPFDLSGKYDGLQWGNTNDDCCLAYEAQGDVDLLSACAEKEVETLCTLEVFEDRSQQCNSV